MKLLGNCNPISGKQVKTESFVPIVHKNVKTNFTAPNPHLNLTYRP